MKDTVSASDVIRDSKQAWERHQSHAVLLDLLGQQPIAFHRAYVDITGNVLSALWLSNAISKINAPGAEPVSDDGIFKFQMTAAECIKETGMSWTQHNTSKRLLHDLGLVLQEYLSGKNIVFSLNLKNLAERMLLNSQSLAQQLEVSESDAYLVDSVFFQHQA